MYLFNPGLPQRGQTHLSTRRPTTKGTFRPDPGSTHIRNSGKGRMLQAQHNVSFIPRVEAGRSQPNCKLLFSEPAWPDGRPAGRAGSSQASRSPESRPGHRQPCAFLSGPVEARCSMMDAAQKESRSQRSTLLPTSSCSHLAQPILGPGKPGPPLGWDGQGWGHLMPMNTAFM